MRVAGGPEWYTVRVAGHLDDARAAWLGGWRLTRDPDGTTALTTAAVDQAGLHGLLDALHDLGATLLTVSSAPQPSVPSTLPSAVTTARLTLRPATADDADATWPYRRLESVSRWLPSLPSDRAAHRQKFIEPDRLSRTILIVHAGRVVGDLMLKLEECWSQAEAPVNLRGTQAELGWALHPDHTGHGFATEAVEALIEECFTRLGVRRVIANCFLDNTASWRLMERVGMRREQHAVRESLHRSGEWLDSLTYALLAEEWRGRSAAPSPSPRTGHA